MYKWIKLLKIILKFGNLIKLVVPGGLINLAKIVYKEET
jgi:hypothetical protein